MTGGSIVHSPYVYNIDDASLKKAKAELYEDPKNTQGALDEFRKWIAQQPWLKTPTDDKFLLSFLRNQKFSLVLARERLVKFWTGRTENPLWFLNIDTMEERLSKMFDIGSYVILPGRDKEGRFVIIHRLGQIKIDKHFDNNAYMKFFSPCVDFLMMVPSFDERKQVQVNGIVFIDDYTGVTMSHITALGADNFQKAGKLWMNAFPLRYKTIHYYAIGPVFQAAFAIFKPVLTKKFVSRITFHGHSLVTLYDHVDKSLLPAEYLPDDYTGPRAGTFAEIAAIMKKKIQSKDVRETILDLSSGNYGVDLKMKPKSTDIPQESFRKLNID